MKNNTRTLGDEQVDRIEEHYYLLYNNHKYLAHSFRPVSSNEVLMFILNYIKPDLQHFKAIEDDAVTIANQLQDDSILIPIM